LDSTFNNMNKIIMQYCHKCYKVLQLYRNHNLSKLIQDYRFQKPVKIGTWYTPQIKMDIPLNNSWGWQNTLVPIYWLYKIKIMKFLVLLSLKDGYKLNIFMGLEKVFYLLLDLRMWLLFIIGQGIILIYSMLIIWV
jgi:hypothetical protein